jgi:hypothetical protein
MPLYRKIVIILVNNLFRLLLFFTISIVATVLLYADRSYVPTVLARNNVYEKIVSSLLETNKEQSLTVGGDITLDDPDIQKIVSDSFPAAELEQHTNTVINAAYDWLEQEKSVFSFSIDLTENKQRLAEGLSDYAINRLRSLPVCLEFSLEIDPFSATCQPSYIDYEAERATLVEQFVNEAGFLDETIITEKSIFNDENDSLETKYTDAPIFYSLATVSPLYISLVLVSLALIVIFASSTKKIGLRKIGRGLVGAGTSLIFFAVIFSFVLPRLTGSLSILQTSGEGIDALLNDVALDFSRDYAWMTIKICAPLIAVGALMISYAQLGLNKKDYKSAKLKSGVVSSNEQKKNSKTVKKAKPPIQSSESSETKPKRTRKNAKYRKIPKKEL